jgi:UDP:flavonoid glycosyltransferase YjiC (YdhE family)
MTARVLFVTHDAGGTIPPVLAVAEALIDEGHDVTILSQPSVRVRAAAVGARFVAFRSLPDYDRRRRLEEQLELTLPAITGAAIGDDVVATAGELAPDVIVVDPNLAGAHAAAEVLPSRSGVLLHSLYRTYVDRWFGELWPLLEPGVNETRRHFGVDAVASWTDAFRRHDAIVSCVPSSFDDDGVDASVEHPGFLVPRPRSADGIPPMDGAGPAVLVSLSTTYQQHEPLLAAIVEAVGSLPVRALVTTGGHVSIDVAPLPPNVVVADHVDHASIIDAFDVVVTHGGLGTTAVALANGVPLVCAPIDRDQPINAERVAALGAGVTVVDAGPSAIADAVSMVLGGANHRSAAAALAAESSAAGGARRAAAALLGAPN